MTLNDVLSGLLTSGGDDRLRVDARTGRNRYQCAPRPLPGEISLCSSTASTISAEAFAQLGPAWSALQAGIVAYGAAHAYQRAVDDIRDDLRDIYALGDTDIVVAASGTDLHLLAASLLASAHGGRLTTLTLPGNESGSGVIHAAAGHHFTPAPPYGAPAPLGAPVCLGSRIRNVTFRARDDAGRMRPDDEIEQELAGRITEAQAAGEHCLLVVADVSKTGAIIPSLETVQRLRLRFAGTLDVLIDACQMRLSAATLRAYLAQNLLVAITGSKFYAGPVFSAALLVPPAPSRRLAGASLPPELSAYSLRADWPAHWQAGRALMPGVNFGLVLRWRAALCAMRTFAAVPEPVTHHTIAALGRAVSQGLAASPVFAPAAVPSPDRSALHADGGFDRLPTIFPFYLANAQGHHATAADVRAIYDALATGSASPAVRLGQPVAMAGDADALRLCLSAPLIVRASRSEAALQAAIADIHLALDRVAGLATARLWSGPRRAAG